MSFRDWLTQAVAGQRLNELQSELNDTRETLDKTKAALATVSAQVDDSEGWVLYGAAPGDRDYSKYRSDVENAREAWRLNFFVRRIVNLTHSYVIGNGITITSKDADVQAFLDDFWTHRKNRMARRLNPLCDQLTRDGELFPILYTNLQTGIPYIRFRTTLQIERIETADNDYEQELAYVERLPDGSTKLWHSPLAQPAIDKPELPVMLHWSINKPIDATRGESDLTPVLPWAKRYKEWLSDRVRVNRQRTRQAMLLVQVQDDSMVETKRSTLRRTQPIEAGIYVYGPGEEVQIPQLNIDAGNAEDDGKALRHAIATGSMTAPHYLAEGENVNYASAKEMGEPTARFYTERQQEIIWMLYDLIEAGYGRYILATRKTILPPDYDLQLHAQVAEVARADNEALANAAHSIAQAFAIAFANGWSDRETALSLMLKFAGEVMSVEEMNAILDRAAQQQPLQEQDHAE